MEDRMILFPVNEHPEMLIGHPEVTAETDNSRNSEYSQDISAWD